MAAVRLDLPTPGLAAEQDDRARHQAAAEHAIELRDPRPDAGRGGRLDRGQRYDDACRGALSARAARARPRRPAPARRASRMRRSRGSDRTSGPARRRIRRTRRWTGSVPWDQAPLAARADATGDARDPPTLRAFLGPTRPGRGVRLPARIAESGGTRDGVRRQAAVFVRWSAGRDRTKWSTGEAHFQPRRRRDPRDRPGHKRGRDRYVHAHGRERLGHGGLRRRVDRQLRGGRLLGQRHDRPHTACQRRRESRDLPLRPQPWTGTSRPAWRSTRFRPAAAPGSTTSSAVDGQHQQLPPARTLRQRRRHLRQRLARRPTAPRSNRQPPSPSPP